MIRVITGNHDPSSMPDWPYKRVNQQFLFCFALSHTPRSPTLEPMLRDSCCTRLCFLEQKEVVRRVIQTKQISGTVRDQCRAVDDFLYAVLEHFIRTYAESM